MQELIKRKAANLPGRRAIRARVVDDVGNFAALNLARTYENHGVEAHVLDRLTEEEQIAGTGTADITADAKCIEACQRFSVRKLRERAVVKIRRLIRPGRTRNRAAPRGV